MKEVIGISKVLVKIPDWAFDNTIVVKSIIRESL